MIVYLQGILHQIDTDSIVLLTQGVGYQVFLSKPHLESLPEIGSSLNLHIHSVIREDNHQLFGFNSPLEKSIFLKLIQVNSIGPKLGLTILSGLSANELAEAISREDLVRLTAIPGIGKKTAERLIVDLKDKILSLYKHEFQDGVTPLASGSTPLSEEALSALTNLGYSRIEAQKALKGIPQDSEMTLESMVREGLKALS